MDIHEIKELAAQGDLLIQRISEAPTSGVKALPAEGQHIIVARSSAGNHHVVDASSATAVEAEDGFGVYLTVAQRAVLTHLRATDTHAPLAMGPGVWHVRRQGEQGPDGWQRAED